MKRKNILKAGILLAILLLVLPASLVSATLTITPQSGWGIGEKAVITNTGPTQTVYWNISFYVIWGTLLIPPAPNHIKSGSILAQTNIPVTIKANVLGLPLAKVNVSIWAEDSTGVYTANAPQHTVFFFWTV